MPRQMPAKGYYTAPGGRVYHCSGNLKGNKWYDNQYHPNAGWMTLLWTCVPTIKEISGYTYSKCVPKGVPSP